MHSFTKIFVVQTNDFDVVPCCMANPSYDIM